MIVVSDLPERIMDEIRELVDLGRYKDVSAFIRTSVENQLILERKGLSLESGRTFVPTAISSPRTQGTHLHRFDLGLPAKFSVRTLPNPDVGTDRPVEEQWIWGQVNRLLPVKFATRVLAIEAGRTTSAVPLQPFRDRASNLARDFGLWLVRQDLRGKRRRDERLSTGFPVGKEEEKSLARFASQFIGTVGRDGKLSGALFQMRLANVEKSKGEIAVGLTAAGLRFASLNNPVFDLHDTSAALSDDEVQFYLRHIREHVPGEVYAFRLVLSLISKEVNGPEPLDAEIAGHVGADWSKGLVATQRAGTISRLFELGLIEKGREGRRVTYEITQRGVQWLEERGERGDPE